MPRIKTSGPAVGDHQITIVDTSHDDALQTPRTEPRSFDILRHVRKKARKSQSDDEHTVAIDVLYENQRGAFLCGIPLFSPLTLLNFDPPAWMNGLGQFSPVDVHSAQVPDPTWEWVWDRWHVDMSGDVDQDGWEYNFVFHNNSASWHGTKVWFHAFVRRRRWLRKRKRRSSGERHDPNHNPVEDYFTIYSTTNRNSISFDDGPASRTSIVDDAIPDYATLHRVMRRARLDREKVDALGKFIDEGGDEVQLLGGHIDDILRLMCFQESRRKVLQLLEDKLASLRQEPPSPLTQRRVDALLESKVAAFAEVEKLDFWCDKKELRPGGEADPFVGKHKAAQHGKEELLGFVEEDKPS